ncbi:disulfide bond formation protein B [Sinorhizobium meliloti]|uniref:disulfide bond formation protein B n=1 Tax=Rhizobium meliloti TaxID=382 RepID=UPI000FD9A951|nr:disulfide bond formation protein B [Sinorhizobium meliloti]RVQ50508.1 disulfide bond formation protein B [Sinorhizobium meliloti]
MDPTKNGPAERGWLPLFLAWLTALVASSGALFVGEVMGQTPCVLCWYQRAFMFPLAVVLAIAALRADREVWRYALPLAVCGMSIAGYHVLLYSGLISEAIAPCGKGPSCSDAKMTILGWVPLPVLSLLAFAATSMFLLVARKDSPR